MKKKTIRTHMGNAPKNQRFKLIASAYLFLIRDGKILLSRRFQTGYEDGKYSLPAGHIEEHETLRTGMIREAYEEIGITVKKSDLKLVHVMHRTHVDERIDYFFAVDGWEGDVVNKEPHKCDDLSWFPLEDLPKNTIPYIREALNNFQNNRFYSEFGWES